MTYYVTFGQQSPFRDGWVEIESGDEHRAREIAFEALGPKWAFMYTEPPRRELFPLGRIGRTLR